MARVRCWLSGHRWVPLAVQRFIDTSWDCNVPKTSILQRCSRPGCSRIRERDIEGHWTFQQIIGGECV